jgi:carbonic anhydrase
MGDSDEISVAGAIKDLLGEARDFLLKQIDISTRLHGINRVILVAHEDCGAYGGKRAFSSDEAEFSKHKEDLAKAKEIILTKFPDLEVDFVFARIREEDGKNKIWFLKW